MWPPEFRPVELRIDPVYYTRANRVSLCLMGRGLMVTNDLLGCQIINPIVRPLLVMFPPLRCYDKLCFLQG